MPVINILISEADHKKLQDDYAKMAAAWMQQGRLSVPPSFEHWAGLRLVATTPISAEDVNHMRIFTAIEKLVTSLHLHELCLAHVPSAGSAPAISTAKLAQALADHFELSDQYVKRLQEVFDYYVRSANGTMDNARGPSLHSSQALEQAYLEFQERTTKALDHLGTERAIGRVEGAIAMLVSLNVLHRDAAREKTQSFKMQARNIKKGE